MLQHAKGKERAVVTSVRWESHQKTLLNFLKRNTFHKYDWCLLTPREKEKKVKKETRTDLCIGAYISEDLLQLLGGFSDHDPRPKCSDQPENNWNRYHFLSTRPCLCFFCPSLNATLRRCYSKHYTMWFPFLLNHFDSISTDVFLYKIKNKFLWTKM